MTIILNNVSYYRRKKGLTQTQLARIVGYSKNTISSLETSNYSPGVDLVFRLCLALEVDFMDLFYCHTI